MTELCKAVKKPHLLYTEIDETRQSTTGKIADDLMPFIKDMEITDETWPAYKKSLESTIIQYETYKQAEKLAAPTLFVNGLLDFFIIHRNIRDIHRVNRQNTHIKRVLGPHELTPSNGKTAAKIINRLYKN